MNPTAEQQLSERAYQQIKRDIVQCTLQPGRAVSEAQLCELYGLGKAPIRNALARLSQQGLMSAKPRRGYMVAPVTIRAVHDLYRLRLIVEPETARLAAGRVDHDRLLQLEATVRDGYTPGDRVTERRWNEANRLMHVAVAEASGNHRLAVLVDDLLDETQRVLYLSLPCRADASPVEMDWQPLLRALASGDAERSGQAMRELIEFSEKVVMELLMDNPPLLSVAGQATA